jgi:TolB-like protein/DNA-binding winged helix-turn-helix (wHTH) protein/Tfp pilus assembly protein PilF
MSTSIRQAYEFGAFRLDPAERILLRQGELVALTPKVFDTLVLLVENAGRLVTKDEFMKQVWADAFVEEATLAQTVSQLRKALGNSEIIETVSKKGYRFLGPVKLVDAGAPAASAKTGTVAAPVPARIPVKDQNQPQGDTPTGPRAKAPHARWIVAIAVFAVLAAAAVFLYTYDQRARERSRIRSLAVLPLQNLSGDPNQEYFADGMTDELITDLAQIHSLRVISHTSVVQFKHTQKSLPEIAAQLNVDAVVEGSVLRTGNNVRITAQLLDARRDQHLWAASYEREISNVLELQGQVAKSIADHINVKLTPEEGAKLSASRSTNPAAYDALLTAKYLFNRRQVADTEKAIAYLKHSLEIDPNSPEAWSALAYCYAALGSDMGAADPAKVIPQARAAITKALQLDPNRAETHTILAWIKLWYDWDWSGAEQEFHRSLELNPNDSVTHREYSHYLQLRKRFDEAIAENKLAIELAPLDFLPSVHLAWVYVDAHDGAKAVAQSQHVLEMDPSVTGAYIMLAGGYELQGKWTEATAAITKIKASYPHVYFPEIAYIKAASGERAEAQKAFADLTEFARTNYVSPFKFAAYYAALSDRDQAFEYLDKAYRQHDTLLVSLDVNPHLDNLRDDPRFLELEQRVGFATGNLSMH